MECVAMTGAPFPPAVLRALARYDELRRRPFPEGTSIFSREVYARRESMRDAQDALDEALDDWHASRDAAMRAAEDEALCRARDDYGRACIHDAGHSGSHLHISPFAQEYRWTDDESTRNPSPHRFSHPYGGPT